MKGWHKIPSGMKKLLGIEREGDGDRDRDRETDSFAPITCTREQ